MKILIARIGSLIFLVFVSLFDANSLLAEEGSPTGCWSRQSFDGRTVSGLWLCFRENGELHGVDVDRGHGADFGAQWKLVETGKLQFTAGGKIDTCSVRWGREPETLTLEACSAPFLSGVFKPVHD